MTFDGMWAATNTNPDPDIGPAMRLIAKAFWDAALQIERERCAKVAETWCDPEITGQWHTDEMKAYEAKTTGCYTGYSEGQGCTAPKGIADEIRKGPK